MNTLVFLRLNFFYRIASRSKMMKLNFFTLRKFFAEKFHQKKKKRSYFADRKSFTYSISSSSSSSKSKSVSECHTFTTRRQKVCVKKSLKRSTFTLAAARDNPIDDKWKLVYFSGSEI